MAYSESTTRLYIIALYNSGIDYESIARRIKTERRKNGDIMWHQIGIHKVCGIIGMYNTVKYIMKEEATK